MLIQHWNIGHAQYVWDVRQNIKIVYVFSKIWNCANDELLVSFDGVAYHMPPEVTNIGWNRGKSWYHSDQSFLDNSLKCIQGWVTGYDVNEGDATLSILESSNNYHKDFKNKFEINAKEDWYKLNENELTFYTDDKDCFETRIKCPKGSLVLWDSRTIHCGCEAMKTRQQANFRNIVYVCYQPRNNCEPKKIEKKIKAFEEMRMTSHWPCKATLFSKMPRTYGAPIYEINKLPNPILNELGKKMVGYS
jgi:hypothetical protein